MKNNHEPLLETDLAEIEARNRGDNIGYDDVENLLAEVRRLRTECLRLEMNFCCGGNDADPPEHTMDCETRK